MHCARPGTENGKSPWMALNAAEGCCYGIATRPRVWHGVSLLISALVVVSGQPTVASAQLQCSTLPLPAACVSFAFQAGVTSVVNPEQVLGTLAPGDSIGGTITINTAVPDSNPTIDDGFYADAIECVRIEWSDRSLIFALDPTLPIDERRTEVRNDLPQVGPPTIFSDAVAATTGGLAVLEIATLPPEQRLEGAVAFSYAYSQICIEGLPSPCPPNLLADDSLSDAPGDVTALDLALPISGSAIFPGRARSHSSRAISRVWFLRLQSCVPSRQRRSTRSRRCWGWGWAS